MMTISAILFGLFLIFDYDVKTVGSHPNEFYTKTLHTFSTSPERLIPSSGAQGNASHILNTEGRGQGRLLGLTDDSGPGRLLGRTPVYTENSVPWCLTLQSAMFSCNILKKYSPLFIAFRTLLPSGPRFVQPLCWSLRVWDLTP